MAPDSTDHRLVLGWSTALAAATTVLYAPMLGGQPLDWDDDVWLGDPVLGLPLPAAVAEAFGTAHGRAWYPLLRLSWWLQVHLLGPDPWAAHVVHLAMFALAIPLVASFLSRLGMEWRTAVLATALWAVHPTRVESVAWLTSRKDLLSLLLVLGAGHALLSRRTVGAHVLFALACLTKAAVFPLGACLAAILWATGRDPRPALGLLGIGLVTAVVGAAVFASGVEPWPYPSVAQNAAFAIGLEATWAARFAWPVGLAAVYPVPAQPWLSGVLGLAFLGGAAAVCWRYGRVGLALGAVWLVPLLPVHGLVPMAFWGADRHLLFPSIAASVAVVWLLQRVAPWWSALPLVVVLAVGTRERIPDWGSSRALWEADASRPGEHWVRSMKLGMVRAIDGRFPEAVRELEEADALAPGRSELVARLLIAKLAADGWTASDAAVTRLLQPPPTTAEGWIEASVALGQAAPALRCDAVRQARVLEPTVRVPGPPCQAP
ncbi:MAG: hypothetical protein H6737_14580 [Alphaproteobacteria bacterium]|nr:hypothetical protein [Alphaproteobacteria bacterium]